MERTDITIKDAILDFKTNFDFGNRDNTRRAYFRSIDLFALFLIRGKEFHLKAVLSQLNKEKLSDIYLQDKFILQFFLQPLFAEENRIKDFIPKIDIRNTDLGTITAANFAEYLRWLRTSPINKGNRYSTSSVNLYSTTFYKILSYWYTKGFITIPRESVKAAYASLGTLSKTENIQTPRHTNVPSDFGEIMLKAAFSFEFPDLPGYPTDKNDRKAIMGFQNVKKERLNVLRLQALVFTLFSTGLRVSDISNLTKKDLNAAIHNDGYIKIKNMKTSQHAYVYLSQQLQDVINNYLDERGDASPCVFIQHGKTGTPSKNDHIGTYSSRSRGYGAKLSENSIWEIVVKKVAVKAGYAKLVKKQAKDGQYYDTVDIGNNLFVSPHAFRHHFAQSMIQDNVPLDIVQSMLGHASPNTTKMIYAPEPNESVVRKAGKLHQNKIDDILNK
jgi:site-specific recombinase XerD